MQESNLVRAGGPSAEFQEVAEARGGLTPTP